VAIVKAADYVTNEIFAILNIVLMRVSIVTSTEHIRNFVRSSV